MEARKTHLQQMSGSAVANLMKPSRGIRDDLLRAGGTPKNHMLANRKALKEQQIQNRLLKEELSKPSKELWKLKEFKEVKSKINSVWILFDSKNSASAISSPQRVPTPTKNYIKLNAERVKSQPSTRSPSVVNSPTTTRGEIPRYLINRKLEWAKQEQDRLIALEKEKVPKGQLLLPEKDRQRTLNALKEKKEELIREIEYLPLVIEIHSLKRKKARLEKELEETEAGIELFSRSKVYVPKEEFENFTMQRPDE